MLTLLRRLISRSTKPEEAAVTPGSEPVTLRIPGLDDPAPMMWVHDRLDRHISREIREQGIWELDETRLLMALLCAGHTFVDVGANIGYFTLLGARCVGSTGKVIAFEPDPENFRLLRDNVELNQLDNVVVEQVALSDQDGPGQLFLSDDNLGDHTIFCDDATRQVVGISLISGAEYFGEQRGGLDVIKVDVQGAEHAVLKGLAPVLRESLPGLAVLLEFTPNRLRAAGSSGETLLALLEEIGFYFYIFDLRRHGLLRCEPSQIGRWVRLTEMVPESEGFINLVCCGEVLETLPGIQVDNNETGERDPLEYLLASDLSPWDGALCREPDLNRHLYFSAGWSFPEPWGVWSDGHSSRIKFLPVHLAIDVSEVEFHFRGRYYAGAEQTLVSVNGEALGEHDLSDCRLRMPAKLLRGAEVEILLGHREPVSPADLDGGTDDRRLKYGLESLAWRCVGSGHNV